MYVYLTFLRLLFIDNYKENVFRVNIHELGLQNFIYTLKVTN